MGPGRYWCSLRAEAEQAAGKIIRQQKTNAGATLKRALLPHQERRIPMSVYRVEKTGNFTIMSNRHLQDRRLSLKAKGLLSYMLSLPDDWDYSVRGLAVCCKEGADAIRHAIHELEANGYLRRPPTAAAAKSAVRSTIFSKSPLMWKTRKRQKNQHWILLYWRNQCWMFQCWINQCWIFQYWIFLRWKIQRRISRHNKVLKNKIRIDKIRIKAMHVSINPIHPSL